MTAAQFELLDEAQAQRILSWRFEALTKAGFDAFYTGLGEALRPLGGRVLVVRPGFVRSKMTEGLDAAPLAVTPEEVAEAVIRGVASGAEQIWVPRPMRAVMSALRHVPRPLFRRLPV